MDSTFRNFRSILLLSVTAHDWWGHYPLLDREEQHRMIILFGLVLGLGAGW